MRSPLLILVTAVALLHPGAAAAASAPAAYDWLQDLSLVVLDSADPGALHAAHARIRAAGGTIALLSPPALLVGWIPPEATTSLVGQAHIRAIHTRPVTAASLGLHDDASRTMVEFFNAAARGDLRPPQTVEKPGGWPAGADARPPEPFETWAYLQNLEANGLDLHELAARDVLVGKTTPDARITGNSDRMTGTVAVTLLFVESDGTGTDPNTYTWTPADVQSYVNGVNTGLVWWSAQAKLHNDCWVAFFVHWVPPTDPRCQQWREMILHPSGDVAAMASDVMAKFGYNSGTHTTRVTAFNTAQRAAFGTDWAYTGFVAYNPEPTPGQLTDGISAFAYLTGPYSFLLYRSYGWRPDQVFTHESGHIFGACDEYASACTCGGICIDQPNGNCESCGGGVSCMMRANTFTMCTFTDDQVGWQDAVPCAPAALVPPTATSITPALAFQGTTVQVTIAGQNLLYGAYAEFGAGVSVQSSSVVGTDSLKLVVEIANDATPGVRSVIVSNRDLQSSTLVSAFTIRTTTRHYYAPTGGNVFPYYTPATAANVLANAIAAAAPGDSVLVGSGTLPLTALVLNKGILLSGAWNAGFTARDLVAGKTVMELTGNVFIAVSGSGTGGLDGFLLRHGHGAAWSTPVAGNYGGAVSIVSSSGAVLHCDIDTNQAATSGGFGGGGGIFAANSTVTLVGNTIHGNTATRGGGVYLYASSGSVTGNTITGNSVSASALAPRGAGIVLDGCTNVALVDNVIDGNSGAETGGGLYIVNATGIDVQGGVIAHHTVASSGGGARLESASASFRAVRFARNTSNLSEGGLAAGASTVQVDDCEFLWNTAILYAGVGATNSTAFVRSSLFVGNNAIVGGGLTLGTVANGSVFGNTFDRNTAPNGGGSLMLSDAPVPVTDNILANTTGTAVVCSGTPPAVLDFNIAWNSSVAHYAGCTPGAASRVGDPRFADTTRVDYRLALHSAAIDAGRVDAGFADPDGSRGDCGRYGAHAFAMQQPSAPQNLVATHPSGNVVLRWHKNPEPDVVAYAIYCDTTIGFRPALANFVTLVASPDTSANLGPVGVCTVFTIAAVDTSGYASGYAAPAQLLTTDTSPLARALEFRLHPSMPNPFNPMATIRFDLDRAAPVRLEIYDLMGRRVRTLARGAWPAGVHQLVWDGRDARGERVSSGVYLMRLESLGRTETQKLTILK